jgi:phosphoglycolate phosphatase
VPVAGDRLPLLVDRFIGHYRGHLTDNSLPFPDVAEVLSDLRSQGAPLAVLTNKPQELTVPILDALNLSQYFGVICGAGRYSFNKPDARVVAHVLDELGSSAKAAVMIGDSAVDVATARAARIPVVLLSYGYTPEPPHKLGADAVVDAFTAVPQSALDLVCLNIQDKREGLPSRS